MSKTLGASLASRFAVSSADSISRRKKTLARNKTLTCATTAPVHDAVRRLAIKLDVTNSRLIELAIEELCVKHGVSINTGDSDE